MCCFSVSGDASASKPEEVKRLPGGKVKKKVGSHTHFLQLSHHDYWPAKSTVIC